MAAAGCRRRRQGRGRSAVSKPNPPWDGPTTGPTAEAGKTIVYVSTDQRNGGARGVGEGVEGSRRKHRLDLPPHRRPGLGRRPVDGARARRSRSKPDGIVLGGIDATEQSTPIEAAAKQGIAVVGWHAYAKSGPHDTLPIFTNITTDPLEVASAAASLRLRRVRRQGRRRDLHRLDLRDRDRQDRRAMAGVIEGCGGCKVLEFVDTPLAEPRPAMPPMTTALLQRYGDDWTHALSINDLTFDFMAPSLAAAGIDGDGHPRNISAGDGSEVAFQRIRAGRVPGRHRRRAAAPAGLADRRRGQPRLHKREGQRLRRPGAPVHHRPTSSSTAGRTTPTTRTTAIPTPT